MRLLLDSHPLLWWLADDRRLGSRAREWIAAPDADVAISAASVWELGIKHALGKLTIPSDLSSQLSASGIDAIDVTLAHGLHAAGLPPVHGDPFDRMLVAQAQLEGRSLVTRDPAIARYDVHVLPAGV